MNFQQQLFLKNFPVEKNLENETSDGSNKSYKILKSKKDFLNLQTKTTKISGNKPKLAAKLIVESPFDFKMNELYKSVETNKSFESPIRAEIQKNIISDFYANFGILKAPILEFRKKKVLYSEDRKCLKLLLTRNYTQTFKNEIELKTQFDFPNLNVKKDFKLEKLNPQNNLVRRISNFWNKNKTNHFWHLKK